MPVGTDALIFWQGEDINPRFNFSHAGVTDVTGWTTSLVIKETAAETTVLHSAAGIVENATDPITFRVPTKLPLTLAPGQYVYSFRRDDSGFDWQLAHGTFTVLDSAHKDFEAS